MACVSFGYYSSIAYTKQVSEHLSIANRGNLRRIAIDPNRAQIDRVVTEMLGLSLTANTEAMLSEWRRLMCLQPIVNGNNKSVLNELRRAGLTP